MRYIVYLYNCHNQPEPVSRFGMFAATRPSLKPFLLIMI